MENDAKNGGAGGYLASLAGKANEKLTEKLKEKYGVEPFDTLDEGVAHWTSKQGGYELVERTETRASLVSKWSTRGATDGRSALIAFALLFLSGGLALPLIIAVLLWMRLTGRTKRRRLYMTLEVGDDGRVHRSAELR